MESSHQNRIRASSCSEAVTTEAVTTVNSSIPANIGTDLFRSQLFTQAGSQHEYHPQPHHLLNQKILQPRAESSSMQFNSSHSHREQGRIQQKSAAIDLHQLLGFKNQSHHLHESTQKSGQTWTHSLSQNDVTSQLKRPKLPQRLLPDVPSALVDSICRTGNVCSDDWMKQAYHELQSVREMHLSDLSTMYMKVCYSSLQSLSTEQAARLEYTKGCIERMVQFLNMPLTEFVRLNKDRFYTSLYKIIKNVEMFKSRGSVSAQPFVQSLSQLPRLQQWLDSELQSQAPNPGSSGNTGSPTFQVQEGRKSLQLNMTGMDFRFPVAGTDLRNVSGSALIGSSGPTLQQTNFSPMTVPPNSATSSPELKRQTKRLTTPIQALKQPINQPWTEEKKYQMPIEPGNEINEKQLFYPPQSLIPSSCFKVSSEVTHPLFLGHTYPKQLQCPLPEESPSKSIASTFAVASPSSPAMQSSSPVCLEKYFSPVSSFAAWDSTEPPETPVVKSAEDPQPLLGESSVRSQKFVGVTLASIQTQLLALGTPEKSDSLSLEDRSCPKENQVIGDKELSIKCLNEMVESLSSKALIASVQDIISVIILIDSLSGAMVTRESLKTVCEDLAADTVHSSEQRNSSLLCKGTISNLLKRNISTSTSCLLSSRSEKDSDACPGWQTSNWELSATSSNKRQRTEAPSFQLNYAILEEIKQTNQSLIETVVDVTSGFKEDVDAGFHADAIVRCSYSAVGLDHNLKQWNISFIKLPILLVHLLLPTDYPKSSPRVWNTSSLSCSERGKLEDLTERAKVIFSLSLRKLSEPFSLRDMARTWDFCARSVLSEFAKSFGGGSFSSKYGSWENCTTVA